MPTTATKMISAAREIDHALLSLIGSIVSAPIANEDAFELLDALLTAKNAGDMGELRTAVERVLRTQVGPNMENVTRHCHELRQKTRAYMRLDAGE